MQKRNNYALYFVVFLVLSIIIFALSQTGILNPITSIFQGIFAPIQKIVFSSFTNSTKFSQNSEIASLKTENRVLTKKLADQAKILKDNKALRDQFTIQNPKTSILLEADIIGAPSFIPGISYPETLIINQGKGDGVKIGQAVVLEDNLVGKITNASDNVSTITLITNSSSSFTAKTIDSNSQGVAKGEGGGKIILDNVLLSDSLKREETLLTKGDINQSGVGLPPDLIVGKIRSVSKNPSDLFQKAEVQSFFGFYKT